MFADTEAKVTSFGEVSLSQLVFLDLETSLEDFLGLGTSYGDVNCDLFVSSDTEGSDSVSGLACGLLELIQAHRDRSEAYCRRVFVLRVVQAPLRLWSNDHQIHQLKCSEPACRFAIPS